MPKKINVQFDDEDEPKINGERTTPHNDGNNGRSVYITPHFVLKVDDRGYEHDDLAVWRSIKKADRKYFIPTLAQGKTPDGIQWSIQPYLNLDWNTTEEAAEIVEELVWKYALSDIDTDYDEPRNWAMHNGQPVIFDYGL